MEVVLLSSSSDQSNKRIRNPKRNLNSFMMTRPCENFVVHSNLILDNIHGRFFHGPPQSLSSSSLSSPQYQPPLLPLPTSKPYSPLPSRNRGGLLSSPTNPKMTNRSKDQDRAIKKPKSSTTPKKQDSKAECMMMITSTNRLGPDPRDLPKEVSRVLKPVSAAGKDLEFSGSLFSLSPPPSSLPLPKFSMRPKLGCNAEAGGVDAGATDNLRRLLRLRLA